MSNNTISNPNSTNSTAKQSGIATGSPLQTGTSPFGSGASPVLPKKMQPQSNSNNWLKSFQVKHPTFDPLELLQVIIYSLGRTIRYFLLLSLISFLVVHFCPETAGKYPALFQFFEGLVECYEFMFRVVMSLVNVFINLITLNFGEAGSSFISLWNNFFGGIANLISEFVEWLKVISF